MCLAWLLSGRIIIHLAAVFKQEPFMSRQKKFNAICLSLDRLSTAVTRLAKSLSQSFTIGPKTIWNRLSIIKQQSTAFIVLSVFKNQFKFQNMHCFLFGLSFITGFCLRIFEVDVFLANIQTRILFILQQSHKSGEIARGNNFKQLGMFFIPIRGSWWQRLLGSGSSQLHSFFVK